MVRWTYLLILTVPVGFFLLQTALHAGRLVASQPGITLANPLVAALWGIGIFAEDVRGFLLGFQLLTYIGGILLVGGVVLLVLGRTGRAVGGRRHYY